MTGLLPALAGANVIYGLGMIESGITFDYGQLVMDNEIAGMIKHAVRGIAVNDATLAVDVIREVGPFKDFLAHRSTYDFMRSQSQSQLIDRKIRDNWEKLGSKDLYEKSWEKANKILEEHHPEPLPDKVIKKMRDIINDTEEELGVPISTK